MLDLMNIIAARIIDDDIKILVFMQLYIGIDGLRTAKVSSLSSPRRYNLITILRKHFGNRLSYPTRSACNQYFPHNSSSLHPYHQN